MQTVQWKVFDYGESEMEYLRNCDPLLGQVIDHLGHIDRMIIPDLFAALVFAFVGQLISVHASHIIFSRMQEQLGPITPSNLANISLETIKACGIQRKKAMYIQNIASDIMNGNLDLEELHHMNDKAVIQRLCQIDGIGPWTAEMLLLNSMERPDVMSYGDIAIVRGLCKLYGLSELSKIEFERYRQRFSPYCSVASIYIWRFSSKEHQI